MQRSLLSLLLSFVALTALAACGSIGRSQDAAEAKHRMVGMSKEDVLACMGPARKKDMVGATEVWQYRSTDNTRGTTSNSLKASSTWRTGYSERSDNYCLVSIVMKNDVVARVNYTGPTNSGSFVVPDEQCGYAVANCVTE